MSTTTIRVSVETRTMLRELAQTVGLPMQQIMEQALENYRRQHLLNAANVAYAQLRADGREWQVFQEELAEWDVTLNDGLEGLS